MNDPTPDPTPEAPPSIIAALVAVMDDVGAIGRNATMTHGERYKYRRNDDVLEAVHPALVAHGVLAVPTVLTVEYRDKTTKSGNPQVWCSMKVEWTFYGPAGDSVSAIVVGEASDTSDKATNKAHTASQKIALTQVLSIPYSQDDPDDDRQQIGAPTPAGGRQRPSGGDRQGRGRQGGSGQSRGRSGPDLPPAPRSTDEVVEAWVAAGDRDRSDRDRLQDRLDALTPELAAAACGRMSERAGGFPVRDVESLPPAWLTAWRKVIERAEEANQRPPEPEAAPPVDEADLPAEYHDAGDQG